MEGQPGGQHPPYLRDRYRFDGEFRSRVKYAAEHGIPLSVFLGRVPEPGEPVWLPEDRDVVAVWQSEEAKKCAGCGTYSWEWDDDAQPYEPDHYTCRGCQMIEQHAAQLTDQSVDGVKVALYRRRDGD